MKNVWHANQETQFLSKKLSFITDVPRKRWPKLCVFTDTFWTKNGNMLHHFTSKAVGLWTSVCTGMDALEQLHHCRPNCKQATAEHSASSGITPQKVTGSFYQYATSITSCVCIINSVEVFFIKNMLERNVEVCILSQHATANHQAKFTPGKCLETKR